jgi:hypothetical protein
MKKILEDLGSWWYFFKKERLPWLYNLEKRYLYHIRDRFFTRWHILDMSSPQNGYVRGWMDRSDQILYANFALLKIHMEQEKPGDVTAWDYDDYYRGIWKEINELYNWWIKGRAEEHERLHNMPMPEMKFEPIPNTTCLRLAEGTEEEQGMVKNYADFSKQLEDKDEEMLIRLIKIRGHLWT